MDPSEAKKVQRLQSKLADLNAKIESLSHVKLEDKKEDLPTVENKVEIVIPAEPPKPDVNVQPVVPSADLIATPQAVSKSSLKEASREFFLMRKGLKQEKLRVKNLHKVLSALKLLSRASAALPLPPVVVTEDQVNQAKSDLNLAQTQMSEKRQLVKDQSHSLRDLIRLHRQMDKKHHKHGKKEGKERKVKKEKSDRKEKKEKRDRKEKKEKRDRKEKKEKRDRKEKHVECQ